MSMLKERGVRPLAFFIIVSIVESSDCTVHYVSSNGTDNGDCGNVSFPCQTLEYIYQQKVKTDDTILVMNHHCDRYEINKTILLSNFTAVDIQGIHKNGCLPTITSDSGIVLFEVKENSSKVTLSLQSLNFLDVGLINVTGRGLETLQVNITNSYIKGMMKQSFLLTNLTNQPLLSNQTIISIHNSTFVSSGMKILGYYIHSNIMVKVTDSKFVNNSMIEILNADTFTFNRCQFKGQMDMDRYIIEANKVRAVEINDLLIEHVTCGGVMKVSASECVFHNIIARYVRAAFEIFDFLGGRFNAQGVVVQNVSCRYSIFHFIKQNSVSVSNFVVENVIIRKLLSFKDVTNVNMMDINFDNVTADGYVLSFRRASSLSISKLLIKGATVHNDILQVFNVDNVSMTEINIENAFTGGAGASLFNASAVFISKMYINGTKLNYGFLEVRSVANVYMNNVIFEKSSAFRYGISLDELSSVSITKLNMQETKVTYRFLAFRDVTNVNMTNMKFKNSSSFGAGVSLFKVSSVFILQFDVKGTNVTNDLLDLFNVTNVSLTETNIENVSAGGVAVSISKVSSVFISNVNLKRTIVRDHFLQFRFTTNISMMSINFEMATAYGHGVFLYNSSSVFIYKVKIKGTKVRDHLLACIAVTIVNMQEINFEKSSTHKYGVFLDRLSDVFISQLGIKGTKVKDGFLRFSDVINVGMRNVDFGNASSVGVGVLLFRSSSVFISKMNMKGTKVGGNLIDFIGVTNVNVTEVNFDSAYANKYGVAFFRSSSVFISNLDIKRTNAKYRFLDLHDAANVSLTEISIENAFSGSVGVSLFKVSSAFLSKLNIKGTKIKYHLLNVRDVGNISMTELNFENGIAEKSFVSLTRASLVFLSKLVMTGTEVNDYFLKLIDVSNISMTEINFANGFAGKSCVYLTGASSVFMSNLVLKGTEVNGYFLELIDVTNISYTDISFENVTADDSGVYFNQVSSVFISNVDMKGTKVKNDFLEFLNVTSISMTEINFKNASAGSVGVSLFKASSLFISNLDAKGTQVKNYFLNVRDIVNVSITDIHFENVTADNSAIYFDRASSVFISKLGIKGTNVEENFLDCRDVANVSMLDINFLNASANDNGVNCYNVSTLHMSKFVVRGATIKYTFLFLDKVDYVNVIEIWIVNGHTNSYVKLRNSISTSLLNVFIENASSNEEMIIVNGVKSLTMSDVDVKNSKMLKLISISTDGTQTHFPETRQEKKKNESFYSVKKLAVREEYSKALTLKDIKYFYWYSDRIMKLYEDRAERFFNESIVSKVGKAFLANIRLENVTYETVVQTKNITLSVKNVNITSLDGRAFNFEEGFVEVSDVIIKSTEGILAINCNLTIVNATLNVSDTAINFRNFIDANLKVKMRDVRIISLNEKQPAATVRGDKKTNVDIIRLHLSSTEAKLELPVIEITTVANFTPSIIKFTNSTLSCPQNSHPYYIIKTNNTFVFEYYCKPCSKGLYMVTDLNANFSLNTVHNLTSIAKHPKRVDKEDEWEPTKRLTTSKTTWLMYERPNTFSCKKCPAGGTCVNRIVSNDNFWGHLNISNGIVKFYPCTNAYCCSDTTVSCKSYNTCNAHRIGTLCSKCKPGYAVDYFSPNCLSASSCKSPVIFWLIFLLTSLLYILAVGYLDQLKTLSTVSKNIFHSLPCLKLFHHEEEEEEEIDMENVELKRFNSTNPIDDNCKGDLTRNEIILSQAPDEDKCRWSGIINILVAFYQLKQLLTIDLALNYSKEDTFLTDLFNLELIKSSLHLCPSLTLNDFEKLVIKDLIFTYAITVPVLVMPLLFHIIYIYRNSNAAPENDIYASKRDPENISLLARCYACFIRLIAMRYKNMTTFTLIMLHCVTVGNVDVLYVFTEMKCWGLTQYMASSFLWLWIVPFPLSLFLSLKLLKSGHISTERFLFFMVMPAIVPIFYVWQLCRYAANHVRTLDKDDNKLKTTIQIIFEQPYKGGSVYWHSWLLYQRLIVAYLVVFYIDPISRLSFIFPILVFFLLVQLQIKPYKDDLVNQLESVSISLLIIFAGVNMLRAFIYVNRDTNDESIISVLNVYDGIDLVLSPITFLVLYFTCQLFLKVWEKVRLILIKRIRKKLI